MDTAKHNIFFVSDLSVLFAPRQKLFKIYVINIWAIQDSMVDTEDFLHCSKKYKLIHVPDKILFNKQIKSVKKSKLFLEKAGPW